jgi:hypothetical protein
MIKMKPTLCHQQAVLGQSVVPDGEHVEVQCFGAEKSRFLSVGTESMSKPKIHSILYLLRGDCVDVASESGVLQVEENMLVTVSWSKNCKLDLVIDLTKNALSNHLHACSFGHRPGPQEARC